MKAGLTPKGNIPPNVSHSRVRGNGDEKNIFSRQESNPHSSVTRSHSLVTTPSIYLLFVLPFSQSVRKPQTTAHYQLCIITVLQWPPNKSPITFVALSAVTINRNGRRDVSLDQHTVKPQPRLQISPPVAPRASESLQGPAQVEFISLPSALHQRSGGSTVARAVTDSGTSTFVNNTQLRG